LGLPTGKPFPPLDRISKRGVSPAKSKKVGQRRKGSLGGPGLGVVLGGTWGEGKRRAIISFKEKKKDDRSYFS